MSSNEAPAAATTSSSISDSIRDNEFTFSDVGVGDEEKGEASPDTPASTSTPSPTPKDKSVAEALLGRCTSLLEEIEAFQGALSRNDLEKSVQLRPFLNQVRSEHRCLQAVCNPHQSANSPASPTAKRWTERGAGKKRKREEGSGEKTDNNGLGARH